MKKMIIFCLLIGILLSVSVGVAAEKTLKEKPVWTMVGDSNRDLKVDAKDALIVLKIVVMKSLDGPIYLPDYRGPNREMLTDEQAEYYCYGACIVSDVDNDKQIKANDALQILQYAVGKQDAFPRTDVSAIESMIWEILETPTDK